MEAVSSERQAKTSKASTRAGLPQPLRVAKFELLRQFRRRRMVLLLAIAGIVAAALFGVMQAFGAGGETAYSYASSYGGSSPSWPPWRPPSSAAMRWWGSSSIERVTCCSPSP